MQIAFSSSPPQFENHLAGTVTSCGNSTIRNIIANSAHMNGSMPRVTSSIFMRPTPATVLSTVPTGGVISPMALLMMNSTPKYTGSMPAALTTGISTGVRMRIVGVMSIAVPTAITSTMIAIISSVWLPMKGWSSAIICWGIWATVMSQDETSAAATRNMMTAVIFAALTNTLKICDSFISRDATVATNSAYTAATTAASVGVNTPKRKPTRMISGSII